MEVVHENINRKLKISDDVIMTITKLAALDVKGVASLNGEINALSKLRKNVPVHVSMIEDVAAIDVEIRIKGKEKAAVVAQEVQTAVKENVQNMTGIPVARVNVTVSGAVFD